MRRTLGFIEDSIESVTFHEFDHCAGNCRILRGPVTDKNQFELLFVFRLFGILESAVLGIPGIVNDEVVADNKK